MAVGNQRGTTHQLNILMVFLSIILGIIACVVSSIIYKPLSQVIWSPLAVGIHFLIFSIIFVLGMVIFNVINGNMSYHTARHHDGGKIALCLIGSILLIFVLATLFEFIYELNFSTKTRSYTDPTSYVFITDISGSMIDNDPEGKRYQAIQEIVSKKDADFPYAVYTFNDNLYLERATAPVSAGEYNYTNTVEGGTAIYTSLEILLNDYNNGNMGELGSSPKFLLLSDGCPTDIDVYSQSDMNKLNKLLSEYVKTPITISTVGLGDQVYDPLMQDIADATGGVYINVDDAAGLEQSMATAVTKVSQSRFARTLFTYRIVPRLNILYAIERIVFLAILAFLISATALFSTGKGDDQALILISSLITSLVAGPAVEVAVNIMGISPFIMKIVYFIFAAMTFITVYGIAGRGNPAMDMGYMDDMRVNRPFEIKEAKTLGKGSGYNNPNAGGSGGYSQSTGGDFYWGDDVSPTNMGSQDSFSDFDNMSSSSGSGSFDSFDDFNF